MSSDLIYLDIVGGRNITRNMDQMPDTVRAILLDRMNNWTERLKDKVMENIQSRLKQKTGKLANSVEAEVIQEGLRVEGRIYIAGVPYAHIQDEGGVTPAHIIRAHDKVMAFIGATGDKVFASRVFHPGGVIPATHFMKDAYREMAPEISRGIKNAIVQGIRQNMRQS